MMNLLFKKASERRKYEAMVKSSGAKVD